MGTMPKMEFFTMAVEQGKEIWDGLPHDARKAIKAKLMDIVTKRRGSKVKMGAYAECPLEMFGDKACIVVNGDKEHIIPLTADTVVSYRPVLKEKKKLVKGKLHKYYYLNILFKSGEESYARMRKKYLEAMDKYC